MSTSRKRYLKKYKFQFGPLTVVVTDDGVNSFGGSTSRYYSIDISCGSACYSTGRSTKQSSERLVEPIDFERMAAPVVEEMIKIARNWEWYEQDRLGVAESPDQLKLMQRVVQDVKRQLGSFQIVDLEAAVDAARTRGLL